jgi:mono/diheme cytochrome c family protein
MKKFFPLSILAIGLLVAYVSLSTPEENNTQAIQNQQMDELGFPEDIMKIFDRSCFDCHISESSNSKAKLKLNFSKWENLSSKKKVSKLDDICEDVREKDMPPKKYLEKYPDNALSDEEISLVCKWVDEEAEKLMQEKD